MNRDLTPRQRTVIEAAMRGLTARQIAAELGIAEDTARTHTQAVIRRLGAHNMVEAAVIYLHTQQDALAKHRARSELLRAIEEAV